MTDTREPFETVECDFRGCNRVYGVTCNAALGVTGTEKCFNTRASCQDPASFDRERAREFTQGADTMTVAAAPFAMTNGFTVFMVVKRESVAATSHYVFDIAGASSSFSIRFDQDRLYVTTTDGTLTASVTSQAVFNKTNEWYVIGVSMDWAANRSQVYVRGQITFVRGQIVTESATVPAGPDPEILVLGSAGVGGRSNSTLPANMGIAYLYLDADTAVDFEDRYGVQNFLSTNGIFDSPAGDYLFRGNAESFAVNQGTRDDIVFATTQDRTYDEDSPFLAGTTETRTFYMDTLRKPRNVEGFPFLKKVKVTPSIIKPQEGMGVRATIDVQLTDAPHHDIGIDPYVDDRSYDPLERGTFWAKHLVRNPYYVGQPLRHYRGRIEGDEFVVESLHNFRMETMAGPSSGGQFKITGKDLLKLADNDRAKAPREATAALTADLNTTATSFTVQPAGAGNNYAAAGYVRINQEVMAYTRSSDTFTVTRGQYGTAAAAHGNDDNVQECYSFAADVGKTPQEIVYDLFINYVDNLPPSAIDFDEWAAQEFNFVYQGIVTEPEGVRDLVNELAEQAGFYVWPDEEQNTIRFHRIRPVGPNAKTLEDRSNLLKQRTTPKVADNLRVGAVTVYFGQRDPTEDLEKKSNYRGIQTVLSDSFDATKYPDPRIKEVFSRWIIQGGRSSALDTGRRIAQRFGESPLIIEHATHIKDKLKLGDLYLFESRLTPDFTGAPGRRSVLAIESEEAERGTTRRVVALQERYEPPPLGEERIVEYTVGDSFNRNAREDHDAVYQPPTGGETVRFIVPTGAFIGSLDASLPAFDVGVWPTSVTVIVEVVGRIQGKGGDGGETDFSNGATAYVGQDGGTAIYLRRPITLVYPNGEIFAGGGGGGGGFNEFPGGGLQGGLGGGGGAGTSPGAGGIPAPSFPEPESANGRPGTKDAGGAGGTRNDGTGSGGTGGDPGQPGTQGTGYNAQAGFFPGADGGSEGLSIDGIAFVTVSGAAGDLRGPTA